MYDLSDFGLRFVDFGIQGSINSDICIVQVLGFTGSPTLFCEFGLRPSDSSRRSTFALCSDKRKTKMKQIIFLMMVGGLVQASAKTEDPWVRTDMKFRRCSNLGKFPKQL